MWLFADIMRPPVDFVSTGALKGLCTVLLSAPNHTHVQNALVFYILVKLRMAVVLTNRTVRNSTTKMTSLQPPPTCQ